MQNKSSIFSKIIYIILIIILLILITWIYGIYQQYNFNQFSKSEYKQGTSRFVRDEKEKYDSTISYKIESFEFNDALFSKTVEVTPNTTYRVKCMVKTKNVQNEKEHSNAGANICIADTIEKSKSITGSNDWQELELMFNSKNRERVDIAFRLGSYEDNTKGEVWFSNFNIEEGITDNDNDWNVVCFLIKNIDVTVQNGTQRNVKLNMTIQDINDMTLCMEKFKSSMNILSNYKININYDIIEINEPLTTLSYQEENGYFVSDIDVETLIDEYVKKKEYDHIFISVRLGDMMHKTDIPVYDWIGLGSMDYYGIGFSNIRLPNDENNYIYKYDSRINTFPEEVFVHEFLHSLERTCIEYGFDIPALHDYEIYGYKNQKLIGLRQWYKDYMTANIEGNKGLNQEVYKLKPVHESNFRYSYKLDVFKEPENIIEEIKQLLNTYISIFK